jgi:hypothetical protein
MVIKVATKSKAVHMVAQPAASVNPKTEIPRMNEDRIDRAARFND